MAEEIDEDFLLASIGNRKEGRIPPEKEKEVEVIKKEEEKPKVPSKRGRKRNIVESSGDYENDFLCRNEINDRKSVYVSTYIHEKVKKIVLEIGGLSNLSVGGYIDNVLRHHLEKHKDEINTLYKQTKDDLLE
ncbi:DUF3408 domain-containing protein [Dysgonomonas sp. Marseille-P4677]|uniref:DUF3408 domain-containing protein n=1 Tax=Dysgonomonas sp. Marseille-P4677 TaxID=2364790 RepID=UPI0019117433|nr:DUF3408 domain-containing protein [Dysgonomonas sp. Marseille-P4677]MBK5720202.1 DUF3408 domain-containing protein [Dysgonomonas sp. Marseille-P4677]